VKGDGFMTSQKDDGSTGYRYHRRSTRLSKHDYTRGIYFVTIRTQTHDPLFEIPQLRAILEETWQALPQRFPGVTLDEFVIMPDHVHFILRLDGQGDNPPTLGRVVGAYKSLVMVAWIDYCKAAGIYAAGSFWLVRFVERVITNQQALARIRQYIRDNPKNLATREY